MWLLREALPTFNANPEGGVFIITSSIAGTSIGGSSMAYSVTKAAQLHLMRCMAQTQGSKVRINAVLPGLLLTEWVRKKTPRNRISGTKWTEKGRLYSPEAIKRLEQRATLKTVTDLGDCADIYISIAKNTSMTGQRIQIGKCWKFRRWRLRS
jgi:NAD(P)-dependent dehydrogenase (short-subunit alcohol dehydrogenase family)